VYREIVSLSKVSHQHIVRYYGCWLEDVPRPDPVTETPMIETPKQYVEEDIFKVNWDDPSLFKRETSRSASFARIRFDESEDESSDSDTDSESSSSEDELTPDPSRGRPMAIQPRPSMSLTGTSTDDSMVQRILYIQMEFVEKVSQRLRRLS
jgi:translation initiation factor 2-alpha kinase 4